jgi:glycopeptide antibiotics resistance protein
VRVRDRTLNYTAADLQTPYSYHLGSNIILRELGQRISNPFEGINLSDWIINLVGFIPLGLLLTALGRRASVACIWCAILSLSIEIGQLFTMTRNSSGSDLFSNTLGGAIGAWSGNWLRSKSVEIRRAID